ncbi:MAG: hypothetical protein KDA28_13490 [Phycisphaerales bacterium]|nr:hypothetical protein [Phycisphaerales bacterium]
MAGSCIHEDPRERRRRRQRFWRRPIDDSRYGSLAFQSLNLLHLTIGLAIIFDWSGEVILTCIVLSGLVLAMPRIVESPITALVGLGLAMGAAVLLMQVIGPWIGEVLGLYDGLDWAPIDPSYPARLHMKVSPPGP